MREDYCLEDAAGLPEGTDFCVIAESDCMEPYIKRGGRVCVSRKQTPAEGEAGLFLYRGVVYCRQWCEDYTGALYLLCANPRRESENIRIDRKERGQCRCLGRVLTDKKLPMPIYGAAEKSP